VRYHCHERFSIFPPIRPSFAALVGIARVCCSTPSRSPCWLFVAVAVCVRSYVCLCGWVAWVNGTSCRRTNAQQAEPRARGKGKGKGNGKGKERPSKANWHGAPSSSSNATEHARKRGRDEAGGRGVGTCASALVRACVLESGWSFPPRALLCASVPESNSSGSSGSGQQQEAHGP
jgi:hypothetical protein